MITTDITIMFRLVDAENNPRDERFRWVKGMIIEIYDSAEVCTLYEDGFYRLDGSVDPDGPNAYIHARGYPIEDLAPLREFLTEAIETSQISEADPETGEPIYGMVPIRHRKWLVDIANLNAGILGVLNATREFTLDWQPENAAILRRLEIISDSDSAGDSLGTPATAAELPNNGG